jgi:hypothetical protein
MHCKYFHGHCSIQSEPNEILKDATADFAEVMAGVTGCLVGMQVVFRQFAVAVSRAGLAVRLPEGL